MGWPVSSDVPAEHFCFHIHRVTVFGQVDAKVIRKAKCVECIGRSRSQRLRLGTLMMEAGCSSEML